LGAVGAAILEVVDDGHSFTKWVCASFILGRFWFGVGWGCVSGALGLTFVVGVFFAGACGTRRFFKVGGGGSEGSGVRVWCRFLLLECGGLLFFLWLVGFIGVVYC